MAAVRIQVDHIAVGRRTFHLGDGADEVGGEELAAKIKNEIAKWANVIKLSGARVD